MHDADALQSDWISCVFEDSNHRLWIGGTVLLSDNTELDVARRRKDDFVKLIPKL